MALTKTKFLFKKYFNKVLLYNILIALAVIIVLLLIVQAGLKTYTRHDQSVLVPDLRGKSFEEVKKILNTNNLDWQIMDSVYDNSKPPLTIIDQNPKPNSKVKEGAKILGVLCLLRAPGERD